MKTLVLKMTFTLFLALEVGCSGGGGGGGSGNDGSSGPQNLPTTVNPNVQIYSAAQRGFNIIPHFDGESLASCTVVSLQSGQQQEINPATCNAVVQDAQRPPAPACQVLLANDLLIGFEASLCTRMASDGQLLPEADDAGRRAASHADAVLRYFRDHHGRKGLNNQNSDNVSIVHIGVQWPNAAFFPDRAVMVYGDGDGVNVRDLTLGADVAAHEMTHGVVAYTARLINQDQSGALNEGTADFFGKLATGPDDWIIGKEVDLSGKVSRDLANPGHFSSIIFGANGQPVQAPYPAHISQIATPPGEQMCSSENDNCFVHYNSTIPSHAAYLMVQALGQEKAEKIYYLALTQYFGPAATFQDAADANFLACQQLYSPADCNQVSGAWAAVGLTPAGTAE